VAPKFPEPPADLAARLPPRLHRLPAGTELWRVYFRGGRHPGVWNGWRAYGPVPGGRFDHHEPPPRPQPRAILYAAADGVTGLAEVFQAARVIDATTHQPWLVGFSLGEELTLLDLTGTWPTAAGASMAISAGPRPRAQRWSRAIYEAYPGVQGLWYPSSMHANRPAAALYERARPAVAATPFFHRALADPLLADLLAWAAEALGYGLTIGRHRDPP
jgi:hypothetical protein